MKVYTLQLAKWRIAKARGIRYLDTTVKSGIKTFAPTWDIVTGVKGNKITPKEYTEIYKQLMRESYLANTDEWLVLLEEEEIAICCYCPEGAFCHRHLLVKMFEALCKKKGIDFEYLGELTNV